MFDLMLAPLAAALVILGMNAYFGLHVIRRGVIFVDLAFAQVAALGGTVALLLGAEPGSAVALLFTFVATLLGALIFSLTRLEASIVPQEAIIGITYVVASAAVILLSSFTAEGAEHVSETLTGSLLWITWPAVARIAIAYAVIGAFHYVFRRRMLDITLRPETVSGVRLWDFIFYLTFGIAISFSVNAAGVLMIFSTLVIPATIAFLFVERFGAALALAWLAGAVAVVGGLVVSFSFDVATGPVLVCAFGAALVVAGVVRALRPPATRRRLVESREERGPAAALEA
ncbi:MAG TPA: metal ABC transporter permease [Longimicrobiales bacterium]